MATPADIRLYPRIKPLLKKYGFPCTLHGSPIGYDVATGEVVDALIAPQTVYCTPPMPYDASYFNGEMGPANAIMTFIAAEGLTFAPEKGQTLTMGGANYQILKVGTLRTGTLIGAYALHLG